eukprot:TRINITY_DN93387_c0_g1_i1.p1 TRINITY_DN93387_c0_g1~~TRINITY_DN93387_c0_g1_i1.p1  ORF type:complete len:425 (+),score=119.86 TRINITY_DN93387_c0_g1_i1:97-1371(+)
MRAFSFALPVGQGHITDLDSDEDKEETAETKSSSTASASTSSTRSASSTSTLHSLRFVARAKNVKLEPTCKAKQEKLEEKFEAKLKAELDVKPEAKTKVKIDDREQTSVKQGVKRERGREEYAKDAAYQIRIKAEMEGSRIASEGVHSAQGKAGAVGEQLLAWAVLRPSSQAGTKVSARHGKGLKRKIDESDSFSAGEMPGAGERALQRLNALKRCRSNGTAAAAAAGEPLGHDAPDTSDAGLDGLLSDSSSSSSKLIEKAALILHDGLSKTDAEEGKASEVTGASEATTVATATALAAAFVAVHGAAARRPLLALGAALRSNKELRAAILTAGPKGAVARARQDPREWAGSDVRALRHKWAKESLAEVQVPKGQMAICPECGGQALVNTGRAGSGRAARLSKQYAHYSCTEKECGKVTHVQEG